MKRFKVMFYCLVMLAAGSSTALAGDFDWLKSLSLEATKDPSGYKVNLESRFEIGDVEVNAVLGNVSDPADAYMVLRLGEMSGQPTATVLEQYNRNRDKGWGVLAKGLGIKPGSKEFHELKAGHDLKKSTSGGEESGKKGKGQKGRK